MIILKKIIFTSLASLVSGSTHHFAPSQITRLDPKTEGLAGPFNNITVTLVNAQADDSNYSVKDKKGRNVNDLKEDKETPPTKKVHAQVQGLFCFVVGVDKSDQIEEIVLEFVSSLLVDLVDEEVSSSILIIEPIRDDNNHLLHLTG